MDRASCARASSQLACFTSAIATVVVTLAVCLPMQSQQGGSLADAARQVRAQRQSQPEAHPNKTQQVVDELMDDQTDNGAPGGFKSHNAGDYKVWVPAPYHVEGQDAAGVVLSGPMVGSKHPIVLLGTPVVAHGGTDDAFQDAANQFARLYAQSANCTKTTVANHAAYQCNLAARLTACGNSLVSYQGIALAMP